MIKDSDSDKAPSPDITNAIQQSECLNCDGPFSAVRPLMFVRLVSKPKVLWWHTDHCSKYGLGKSK